MAMGFGCIKVTGDRNNSDGMRGGNTQKIGLKSANTENSVLDCNRKLSNGDGICKG